MKGFKEKKSGLDEVSSNKISSNEVSITRISRASETKMLYAFKTSMTQGLGS